MRADGILTDRRKGMIMGDRLDEAIADRRRDARERFGDQAISQLITAARGVPVLRSLSEALSPDQLSLIVEPKRASAAAGHGDVAALARECELAGASALSIVTDPILSGGSIFDLTLARSSCDLPILARDFIVHPGHVLELRAAGADGVIVPVRAFMGDADDDDGTAGLQAVVDQGHALAIDVVLSIANVEELHRAMETDVEVLNIDNREANGEIDIDRTLDLLAEVPVGTAVISESVAAADEVARLHRAGVDALLLDEGHLDDGLTNAIAVFSDLSLD